MYNFDKNAALKAGYSQQQIDDFLSQHPASFDNQQDFQSHFNQDSQDSQDSQNPNLVGLVQKYFPQDQWQNALKVMQAESGGNPQAHNGNSNTGDDSWGLFQINRYGNLAQSRPSADWLSNPENNVAYAAQMYRQQGWQPWSTAQAMGLTGNQSQQPQQGYSSPNQYAQAQAIYGGQ